MLTAVPVGIAIGSNRIARGILDPLIEFYRPIPPLAYLPLIVIWCGIGELSKVLLIYLAIFAPIAIATATGVRTVDPAKLRAAQSLGATPRPVDSPCDPAQRPARHPRPACASDWVWAGRPWSPPS